ncbi:MAG: flagellar protein FlaG [Colwellia sp.]|jgi:flagellar protein FlaG
MSINTIPVNADNNFILKSSDNLDNTTKALVKNQSTNVVESYTQKSDEKSIIAERMVESTKQKEVSSEEVEKALDIVASFLHSTSKQVDFSRDNKAGKTVITVTDKKTQEVINQFPSEKIISMAEKIQALHQEVESISGLLIDSHV